MYLRFTSDYSQQRRGFAIKYMSVDRGPTGMTFIFLPSLLGLSRNQARCGEERDLTTSATNVVCACAKSDQSLHCQLQSTLVISNSKGLFEILEISIPRHIQFAELGKINQPTTFHK